MEWTQIAPWLEGILAIALLLAAVIAMYKTRYLLPYFNRQQRPFPTNESSRQVGYGESHDHLDAGDFGGDGGGDAGS